MNWEPLIVQIDETHWEMRKPANITQEEWEEAGKVFEELYQYDTRQRTKAHQATDSSEGTKQEGHRNTQASQTRDTHNNKGNKGTEEAKSIE